MTMIGFEAVGLFFAVCVFAINLSPVVSQLNGTKKANGVVISGLNSTCWNEVVRNRQSNSQRNVVKNETLSGIRITTIGKTQASPREVNTERQDITSQNVTPKLSAKHVWETVHEKMSRIDLHHAPVNGSNNSMHRHQHFDMYHPHRNGGHYYFLNRFFYVLETVRFCVYQYVGKGGTLSVSYQTVGYEPVTIYISDEHSNVVYENQLRKGDFIHSAVDDGSYKICMENYSCGQKKIFLSVRVESDRNFEVTTMFNYTLGEIEVQVRTALTKMWHRVASVTTDNFLASEENDSIIWMTWVVLVVALTTYMLQVVEVHRIFREAESKRIFSVGGGQFKIGRLR